MLPSTTGSLPTRRLLLACLLLVASLAACETVLDPDTFVGSYTSAEGGAVLRNAAVRASILSESLWLNRDGTARRVTREHLEYADTTRNATLVVQAPYKNSVDGTRIELDLCVRRTRFARRPPHLWGEISSFGLILQAAFDRSVFL